MGCECTKFGTSSKVTAGDVALNRSVPNPVNNWIEHQKNDSQRINSDTSNKHSVFSSNSDHHSDIFQGAIDLISDTSAVDATINSLLSAGNDHVEIADAHPEVFSTLFLKQRQDSISNHSYRSTIKSWKPKFTGTIQ